MPPHLSNCYSSYLKEKTMFHTIIFVGNLGREPEMRYTNDGQAVTNFTVASNRQYSNSSGETVKETIWFRVSAWGKQAEICNQYLHKGSKVLVEGRLNPDPQTGSPRVWESGERYGAAYEVTTSQVRFLSGREDAAPIAVGVEEDNLPF
jgi:single-strand DNA-binding protein